MQLHPLYLNGAFVESDETIPVHNPSTTEAFAQVCVIDRPAVATAIQHAQAAFLPWRTLTPKARGEWLNRLATELERRREDIARTITLETGKPLTQSAGEITLALDHLRWFAEETRRAYGRVVPPAIESKRHLVIKSPIGVVGAITPWNFPLMLVVRKVAPALAAGCPVVLKPARQTPLTALALAACAHQIQLPRGVLQVVLGSATDIAAEFLSNPSVRKITFTGSTEVGQHLIRNAAQTVKPLGLELGGQAPALVFEDADMDAAIDGILTAKFRNNGQSCIAINRIYVQNSAYESFLARFADRVSALHVGDGFNPATDLGPLIDSSTLARALVHIRDARDLGARLLCGGDRVPNLRGHFLQPTVLADVPPRAHCMIEETFGPVAPVASFETEPEAVDLANHTRYGLAAYVFTRDLRRTFRLMESLEAGTIAFNDGLPTSSHCPFGGLKQSGWGRELGSEGLDAFLETKHISIGL